jgi:hypothetical protein
MYFRWERPAPLTDCLRPSWWLEELVWGCKAWWRYRSPWGRRRVARERAAQDERMRHFQMPLVKQEFPALKIDEIVGVQPMTGEHGDTFSLGRIKFKVTKP